MTDSPHLVQVYKSEVETAQNESVKICVEEDSPTQMKPDTTADDEGTKEKDDTLHDKADIKENVAVFQLQLVSEVLDTKIVDGSKKKTVEEDVSGIRSKLHKEIFVYQGGESDGGGEDDERNAFVRVVFLICGVMLSIVMLYTIMVYNSEKTTRWMRKTFLGLVLFAVCGLMVTLVSYAYCCCACSRQSPINWMLNLVVTLCYCYICAFICVRYAPFVVMGALFTTIVVSLVCLGLAYTSFDFTQFILLIMIAGIAVMVAGLFCTIISVGLNINLSTVQILITIVSAVIFSLMLVIELQMILGGKSVELGLDEYVYGAYLIFTSIISLFFKFLRIIDYLDDF